MALPRTPELDEVEAQATALRTILGGTDHYSELGLDVRYEARQEDEPPLHVALLSVRADPGPTRTAVAVTVQWRAVVPLEGDDARAALYVLADMRSALVCDRFRTISDAGVVWREVGSNYAVVMISASATKAG